MALILYESSCQLNIAHINVLADEEHATPTPEGPQPGRFPGPGWQDNWDATGTRHFFVIPDGEQDTIAPSSPTTSTPLSLNSWQHEGWAAPFTLGLSMPVQTHLWLDALTHHLQNSSSSQMEFIQMRSTGLLDKRTTLPFEEKSSTFTPTTLIPSISPNILDNSESPCRLKEKQCTAVPPDYLWQMLMLVYTDMLSTTSLPPLLGSPSTKSGS